MQSRSFSTFISLLLLLFNLSLRAEPPIALTGRITDPQGAAVVGAPVTLYTRDNATRLRTTTDGKGVYHFERLRAGEYLLQVKASGFAFSAAQEVLLSEGKAATLDISLSLASRHDEIVVTASGTPQPVDEVSKAVTTIDSQQIDAQDEYAVSEALRNVPGLRVQQLGGPGAFTNIKIRGLRNEDTAILIDGLRFRDATSPEGDASAFIGDLLVTNLDRLEVLRGSGSSLYGTNAIGGVINLVTAEGADEPTAVC